MAILLGYARVSEWELRELDRMPSSGAPKSLREQIVQLRAAAEALGGDLHDEVATDCAPGGLDPSWGPPRPGRAARPGQARLQELLQALPDATVVITSVSRLSSVVGEVEWIFTAHPAAPRVVALAERLSTADAAGLEAAREFLKGAASERRARRLALPISERPARGLQRHHPAFAAGVWWECGAPRTRSRDSLEAKRLAGGSNGRPSLSAHADLSRSIALMRAEGMTLQAIANRLNAQGVPTIRGGTKWRPSALQNIHVRVEDDLATLFP
jgi:DNA invertase Pin-like site-specific DNA recombinase